MSATSTPCSAQEIPQTLFIAPDAAATVATPQDASEKGPAPAPATAASQRPDTCTVCVLPLRAGDPVKYLCCGHVFHAFCIDQWLHAELHCPICKTQVLFPLAQPSTLRAPRYEQEHAQAHGDDGKATASDERHIPAAVPLDGTDVRNYGTCRDCQRVFYRDPRSVRPDTAAWYRCAHCRDGDLYSMMRASCSLQ